MEVLRRLVSDEEAFRKIIGSSTDAIIAPGYDNKDNDDETAFERLILLSIPVFNHIKRTEAIVDKESHCALFWVVNNKPIAYSKVTSDYELLETILNILYNFVNSIDGRYIKIGNSCEGSVFFFCSDDYSKNINLKFTKEIWLKDKEVLRYHEKDKEEGTHYHSQIPEHFSNNESAEDFSDVWLSIITDIKERLYISVDAYVDMFEFFEKMSSYSRKLWNDIYNVGGKLYFCTSYKETYLKKNNYLCAFPGMDAIIDYNNSFYELARVCVKYSSVFLQSNAARAIIDRIVNIGLSKPEASDDGTVNADSFWLLSPFALNSLRNLYERASNFVNDEMKYRQNIYAENALYGTFCHMVIQDFKRWIYSNGRNAIVTFEGDNSVLRKYMAHEVSSLSLVRPIRLFEKVKDYIQNIKSSTPELQICVVGYTRIKDQEPVEMIELAEFVAKSFPDIKICYTVKMNSKLKDKRNKKDGKRTSVPKCKKDSYSIEVLDCNYDELFLKEQIKADILKYGLIFFMDCPDLYYDEFSQRIDGSWYSLYNAMKLNQYNNNYDRNEIVNNFEAYSVLDEAEQHLETLSNGEAKGYGVYKPIIRDYLLDYISDEVKNAFGTQKTIYCYMSTLNSNETRRYSQCTFTHKESYNNKCFHIVKISNVDEEPVDYVYGKEYKKEYRQLNFSLWNIIKNINLSMRNTFFKSNVQNYSSEMLLDKIAVRLFWDEQMQHFTIEWGMDKKGLERNNSIFKNTDTENITGFLKDIFELVLRDAENITSDAIKKEVCNVLLGRASEVYHILFYYRLQKGKLKVNTVNCRQIIDTEKISEILSNNSIKNKKDKKLYYDMIDVLDREFIDALDRSGLDMHIKKNGGNTGRIFDNIMYACEQCGCTDLNLYSNMKGA